ncbi:uncharacterized protein LOC131671258 [Phymastichus coffea]|uniref:uncharacterized protein LOC131671258 n=1 Tax=Phymastichus coffea TaxID=108790 RepID=UPI00273BB802|nr:uncharacterized protein LOC131671258 [Phymastichus coffea]XP_058803528.1 uncharacterized protein LOC131671258 [Phymastichus coffea]
MVPASKKFLGDGFVVENCIIKGHDKYYDIKENNLGELIFNALSETPEHIGQIVALTSKKKTFAQLKEQSIRLATWLRKEAIDSKDVVALCSRRHPHTEVIFCAISLIGAIYTPFVHNVDIVTARHCIKTAQPKLVFAHKNIICTLQEAAALENHTLKIVVIDSDKDNDYITLNTIVSTPSSAESDDFQITTVKSEDTCVIVHTSGTTGIPKFIPLSHKQFIQQALQFDISGNSEKQNRIVLTYFYPGWLVQTLFSIRSILVRQTLIFHEDFEPHETCKIIEKYKINTLAWDVYMIALLAESDVMDKYDLNSVTRIHSIGSKLFDQVRGKMIKMFPNVQTIGRGLGILETGLLTLFTENCRNPKSEGVVVPNVQLKVIETTRGEALGPNKVGELCAKSPCMFTGYYKDPQATKAAFDDDGWFHTGDEAYYDENGELIVVGRLKEVIKYREMELQPLLIEQIFLSHPNIVDAAVVGIFHEINIEQPVAFVKSTNGSSLTEQDVLEFTSDLQYTDIFRGWVIFTHEIPRNANGKINRRALRERAQIFYQSH